MTLENLLAAERERCAAAIEDDCLPGPGVVTRTNAALIRSLDPEYCSCLEEPKVTATEVRSVAAWQCIHCEKLVAPSENGVKAREMWGMRIAEIVASRRNEVLGRDDLLGIVREVMG